MGSMMKNKGKNMKNTIFMVTGSDIESSAVFGFYPTREIAEARCKALMSDPDNFSCGDIESNETAFGVNIREIVVGAEGADTKIYFG
jgi:hypothetical protein